MRLSFSGSVARPAACLLQQGISHSSSKKNVGLSLITNAVIICNLTVKENALVCAVSHVGCLVSIFNIMVQYANHGVDLVFSDPVNAIFLLPQQTHDRLLYRRECNLLVKSVAKVVNNSLFSSLTNHSVEL